MSKLKEIAFSIHSPNILEIPVTTVPQSIGDFTMNVRTNNVVKLVANVGWLAVENSGLQLGGPAKVDMILEVWRGPVGTGTIVYRATDSATATNQRGNSLFDDFRLTTISHVDGPFASSQNVTYNLSARLGTPGTPQALIVGPITFYGEEIQP